MGFDVGGKLPILILAVTVAGYFAWQAGQLYRVYSPRKFRFWSLFRALTLLCLLLAAAGLQVNLAGSGVTTLFLVDRSLSMGDKAKEIESWINHQIEEHKGSRDRIGVVSFAREPMIEVPVTGDDREIKLETALDPNFTDLQKALEFCRDYFPGDRRKRLVLITDGRENTGSSEAALRSLGERGINLAVLSVSPAALEDAQLTSLRAPSPVHTGERIPLEAEITANFKTEGKLYLYYGNRKIHEETISIAEGRNIIRSEVQLTGSAGTEIRGEISCAGDQNQHNDSFTITVPVEDSPKVLVVGEKSERQNLEELLRSLGIGYQSCLPGEAPGDPGGLSVYDEIIIANVTHRDLAAGFEAALEKCVGEQGTGLVVVGGDRSFAPGGYENTVMEKLLPVECRMKGKEKLPNTGLVLAVDCSGSMNDDSGGVRKLEMVKEAAIRSMEALEEEDCLGVLAFSDVQEWVVPFGRVTQKAEIENRIGKLEPQGGTLILPGLDKAAGVLEKADVRVKHIILLTDGQAEKEGYDAVADRLEAGGITLSTVAVGEDADRELLEILGREGGGRSYYAGSFRDVPDIFAKETYLATKKYLNNQEFAPRLVEGSAFPAQASLPVLFGYTGTGLKEGADMVLESDSGDPVLAFRHYGLGMAAAWTPDLSGGWSKRWIEWNGFQNYWGMVVNKCLSGEKNESGLDIEIVQKGCRLQLNIAVTDFENGQTFEAKVFKPDGREGTVALKPTLQGVFEGSLDLDWPGSYALDFKLKTDGRVEKHAKRTVHLDYSPEYAAALQDTEIFWPAVFGLLIDENVNIFALPLEKKNTASAPLSHVLLAVALAAFIAELWVRKFL